MRGFRAGDQRAIDAGKRGGDKSAQMRKKDRERYWRGLGIDPSFGEWIRYQGYQAGWRAGVKAGSRRGQEAR